MKTLIAIPCMDTVPVGFAESLLNLHKPDGTKVCFKGNSLVYDSRNLLSLTAIENNFDVVMWLDSDMIVPPDTIEKFAAYCAEGKEMVTGLYVRRRPPVKPVIYDQLDEPGRDADGNGTAGGGCAWEKHPGASEKTKQGKTAHPCADAEYDL